MKVSYNWLSQYIDLSGVTPYELADRLTNGGVAVDIVEETNKGVDKVVVGHVVESEKHPDAEKLNLCKVDVGQGDHLQIICGASNVAKGQKVPVAMVGAHLPGGMKIKKAKLRGIESQGMICSAKELGMNEKLLPKEKTEGILVLADSLEIGEPIEPILGFNDYILELDLTPNRSDCLSMIGVAYEVAAILDREVQLPEDKLGQKIDEEPKVKIKIEAADACNHYASRLLRNITVQESPQWLQNLLIAEGIRPINNVVDVTNYVLLEYGQPLHAFDFDRLNKPEILVRKAKPGETIISLDDQERTLDEEMLLITDSVEPIAIAGVMGGANSEVTKETTSILLESAYFNGASVRRTSKQLGLRSEASLRFEKGVDPNRIYLALNRAAELLEEITGAETDGDIFEHLVEEPKEAKIEINPKRINKLLGTTIKAEEMKDIFRRLRFNVQDSASGLMIEIPTRRQDITIEADLVEEIARIYGYDNIPTTLPEGVYIQGGLTEGQRLRRNIKNLLESAGLQEVITYSFTSKKQEDIVAGLVERKKPIHLAMPMSEERQILRTSLIPNLLDVAKYNNNRRMPDVRIFEIGSIFISNEEVLNDLPQEKLVLSGLVTGELPRHWQKDNQVIDFYYVKGILEDIFTELGLTDVDYEAISIKGYHPGRTAKVLYGEDFLGYIGQLHPEVYESYDLKETYVFELDLTKILTLANVNIDYRALPKYPAIQRDIALVVEKDLEVNKLINTITRSAGKLLEDVSVFDLYMSDQIGKDKKSIAISITYRSQEKTLTDDEVQKLHDKVLEKLEAEYQAELRK